MRFLYLFSLPVFLLVLFQPFSHFKNEFSENEETEFKKTITEPLPSGSANGTLSFLPSSELDDLLKGNELNQFLRAQLSGLKQLTKDYPEKKPYQFSTDSVWAFISSDGNDKRYNIEIIIRDPLFTIVTSNKVWHDLSKPFTNSVWNNPDRADVFVASTAKVQVNHIPMMERIPYSYSLNKSSVEINFSHFSNELLEGEVDGYVGYQSLALNHDAKLKLRFKVKPVLASTDNYHVMVAQGYLLERLITF